MSNIRNAVFSTAFSVALGLQSAHAFSEEEKKTPEVPLSLQEQISLDLQKAFQQNSLENQWRAARKGEGEFLGLHRDKDKDGTFVGWRVLGEPVSKTKGGFSLNVGMDKPKYRITAPSGQTETVRGEKSYGFVVKYEF